MVREPNIARARSITLALVVVLAASIALMAAGIANAAPTTVTNTNDSSGNGSDGIPVVVDVVEGVGPASVAKKHGIAVVNVFKEALNGFSAEVTAAQLTRLRADAEVVAVTADTVVARIPTFSTPRSPYVPGPAPDPDMIPPQKPQFVTAAIRRVGGPSSPTADIDGRDDRRVDADIAVVDGGVDPYHPDLNVVGGVDCVPGPARQRGYYDRDGHGTFVAGMAGAIDNGIGNVGAAPGARIWSIRVGDPSGYVTDSALLCGLEYVLRSKDIDVVNISLAGADNQIGPCRGRFSDHRASKRRQIDRVHQQICRATKRGQTVVAAAGNDAADASAYTPAVYNEVITVSALADFDGKPGGLATTPSFCIQEDRDDHLASFSNFGEPVDIAAPGSCVGSTFLGGTYANSAGTSFAAPLVSGAAALLLAQQPNLPPAVVRERILADAEPGPIPGDRDSFPEGILDISEM